MSVYVPRPKVVALGGGHGLAVTLEALRLLTDRVTAVVTVADDGGSSGRLREEMDVLPPGDLRMALAALCDDSEWGRTWRDLLQFRFHTDGPLNNHAVGNLLIVALWELLGDPTEGLDLVGQLLGVRGRVLPMAAVPLSIEADIESPGPDGPVQSTVRGQSVVASSAGYVDHIRLLPPNPPAFPQTISAVREADWIVLGPGSWYTSVLPHLLVPELSRALHESSAQRVVTLNLSPQRGETSGYTAADHLRVLHEHAPGLRIDAVIADPSAVDDSYALSRLVDELGARLLLRQVRIGDGTARHDHVRLAAAYRDVFEGVLSDVGERGEGRE